jgi:hypothetical protein
LRERELVRQLLTVVSPLGQLGENFVHSGVLLAQLVDNSFDLLVPLALLFQILAGLVLRNLRLEAVCRNESGSDKLKEDLLVAISL